MSKTYAIKLDPLGVTVMVTHSKHMLWKATAIKSEHTPYAPICGAKAYTFCDAMTQILDQLRSWEREEAQDE